jgi:hypothetical protein
VTMERGRERPRMRRDRVGLEPRGGSLEHVEPSADLAETRGRRRAEARMSAPVARRARDAKA